MDVTHADEGEIGTVSALTPAIAHAVERCGFLITAHNRHRFTAKERARWDRALAEYAERRLADMLSRPAHELPGAGR
jgi:hypothetical protein